MTVTTAKKILADNGIRWGDTLDLYAVLNNRAGDWIGFENVKAAIERIQAFLRTGK